MLGRRQHKIDLAGLLEGKFLKPGPVTLIVRGIRSNRHATSRWIEESQQLRVIKEDIDVVTFAMINWDDHGGAAAKRPLEVVAAGMLPKLVNQSTAIRKCRCHSEGRR